MKVYRGVDSLTERKMVQEIGQNDDAAASSCVAVAVVGCRDKNSKHAVKWALDRLVMQGDLLRLIHVRPSIKAVPTPMGNYMPIAQVCSDVVAAYVQEVESQTLNLLRPFQQMCNSKQVQAEIIVLEDDNVPKAILKYISDYRISKLVMGSSSRNIITRKLKGHDVPASIAMKAPKFCSVYVISKGRLASVHASTSLAQDSSSCGDSRNHSTCSSEDTVLSREMAGEGVPETSESETTPIQSQHLLSHRNAGPLRQIKSNSENRVVDLGKEISRSQSNGVDVCNNPAYLIGETIDVLEAVEISENSTSTFARSSDAIGEELFSISLRDSELQEVEGGWSTEITTTGGSGNLIFENNRRELQSHGHDLEELFVSKPDIECELERLKIELQHIRETYRGAFEEAISAKWKAEGRNTQLIEELWKLEEAKVREELARSVALEYRENCEGAMKNAKTAWKATVKELKQRRDGELRAIRESYERKKAHDALESAAQRFRRYPIEIIKRATNCFSESLKIGEGGYGPVYKGSLDHTTVAIKVLRTDADKGRHEFQQEVEVLSRIHHPHMLLLLGTCPERGCLVYEYMANGSLEDHLFDKGTRASLPWFVRFRIASEIASALHFLHTTKPEPIVHRDLKPANILLDSNFVSKIGDVGLAKLIPSTASYSVTEYRNTLLAGTFCYMDPEYLRTGTFRPKSDLYALGIILLQLLTAKHPMALTEKVETAIEEGSFNHILDKTAGGWPLDETIEFAKLALKCTELRRRDRPDLETIVLPELERFRHLADAHAEHCTSWLLKLSNSSGGFTLVQNCS